MKEKSLMTSIHPATRVLHAIAAVLLAAALIAPYALARPFVDDDEIYDQVNRKLNSDQDIHGRIKIEVKNAVVTLTGTVGTEKVKSKAEKIVRKVAGVKEVVNKLEIGENIPK